MLVGDAPPHEANYPLNKDKIDWQTEAKKLGEEGIVVYAIQALNYAQSNNFYSTIASLTGGIRLSLDQFTESPDFVRAICYREVKQNKNKQRKTNKKKKKRGRKNKKQDKEQEQEEELIFVF